jgi:hypothetical protein
VDDETYSLARLQRHAFAAWGSYIAGFRWYIYGVLTFAYRPSPDGAQRAVHEWFEWLERDYPRLFAYVSYDLGEATLRLNVHVLVGGLFVSSKAVPRGFKRALALSRAIEQARRRWKRGQIKKMEPYDTRGGAPDYLAQYCNDAHLISEFLGGRPIRKKKQRRRRSL